MQQLTDFIKTKVEITESDLEVILSNFQELKVEKGQFILRTGQIANHYYFIKSGALRFYYGDYEDQLTAWVIIKDEFFTEISSLNPQIPTRFNIEAIEKQNCIASIKKTWKCYINKSPDGRSLAGLPGKTWLFA